MSARAIGLLLLCVAGCDRSHRWIGQWSVEELAEDGDTWTLPVVGNRSIGHVTFTHTTELGLLVLSETAELVHSKEVTATHTTTTQTTESAYLGTVSRMGRELEISIWNGDIGLACSQTEADRMRCALDVVFVNDETSLDFGPVAFTRPSKATLELVRVMP